MNKYLDLNSIARRDFLTLSALQAVREDDSVTGNAVQQAITDLHNAYTDLLRDLESQHNRKLA